jgi:AsmA-like C-terminal region/AsmA family
MKKVFLGVLALAFVVVIGLGLYGAHLVRSLETPEFKARVAEQASAAVGAKVQLESLDVSLLRGIRLGGIHILNPPGFTGDLLAAEGAKLSYDPWSLLRGHIQVDELSLRKPVITLASDARGAFNYEKLSGPAPAGQKAPPAAAPAPSSSLPRLVVSKLAVDGARFVVVDDKNVAAFRIEGASLDSALAMESGVLTGTGEATVDSVVLADAMFLKGVRAPLKLTKERLSLAPLEARLGGGPVTGEIRVDFKPDMRYALQFTVHGASVATLLKEAGSPGTLTGSLKANAKVEGTGGVLTVKGSGQAAIKDCRWPKAPLFGVLAGLLQIPELADPRFDDCRVEFTLGGGQARTPVVSFKGPALELTGQGVTNLVTSVVDYDLTLALSPGLLGKLPGVTTRGAFKTRPDGFGTIAFKVTGTTVAPKTDLASRFGKAVAVEAAKEGLGRLFGRKKNK